jgi:secreted trypsin-like serine protease
LRNQRVTEGLLEVLMVSFIVMAYSFRDDCYPIQILITDMKFFFSLTLLFITASGFIVRRHDVPDEEYIKLAKAFTDYTCHLDLPDGNGTFINASWILTAAHVAVEVETKLKKGGKHFIKFKGAPYEVDKVIIHKSWRKDQRNDMALLHLSKEIKDAKYAEIYTDNDEKGKLIYIVGNAGIGNGKDGLLPKTDWQYRAATNRIDQTTDHFIKFSFDSPGSPSGNLTEMEGVSGPGDSGGPAFVIVNNKVILIGVGSTQSTKHTNGVEGVYGVVEQYMRVSNYQDWIKDNITLPTQTGSTDSNLNNPYPYKGSIGGWGLIGLIGLLGLLRPRH